MEMFNLRFMFIAALAVIGFMFFCEVDVVLGQTCGADIPLVINQCAGYVMKGSLLAPDQPSEGCCAAIISVDIPCACQHMTKMVEQMVDMGKVVTVARACGIRVDPGMHCGSYTVPPSSG